MSTATVNLTADGRCEVANRVMGMFRGGCRSRLVRRPSGVWIESRHWRPDGPAIRKRIVLSKSGEFLGIDYGQHGMGHTLATVTGQLVRWIRDETRHPLRLWRYWCSDQIGLGGIEIVEALEAAGYDDPDKVSCVLCRQPIAPAGDWLFDAKARIYGPCCLYTRCQERSAKPT